MKTVIKYFPLCLFLAGMLISSTLAAQDSAQPKTSVFNYLTRQENAVLHLEIELDSLIGNRKSRNYLPAVLTEPDGHRFHIELRTRGKFRRKTCEIPPVKLKFSKKELKAIGLDTMNEIKLVIPCSLNKENSDLIVREYIAYRIFEQLSPFSVRARLIQLTLREPGQKKGRTMSALLVEHEEEITARLASACREIYGIPADQLQMDQAALTVLFEYMIGNTDWEITACRNIMLLQPHEQDKCYPVPFDFDFSGFVAAPYASPASGTGLRTVLDRYLIADNIDPDALERARRKILAARPDIQALCRHAALSRRSADHLDKFLKVFFEAAEQPGPLPVTLPISGK
jgi:hypothetical protein